jgi:hypothetical protein
MPSHDRPEFCQSIRPSNRKLSRSGGSTTWVAIYPRPNPAFESGRALSLVVKP